MDLKIFNTLDKELQPVRSGSQAEINLYTCGPTVYNYAHIGNLRSYISADILKRALEFNGHDVNWVMNVTDVDDKTIANTIKERGARANVKDLENFTQRYFEAFAADLRKIGIDTDDISFVKVTEKVADIQLFILELIKKGYAYTAEDGSTYFSIEAYQRDFGDYGKLVGEKFLDGKKIGARVAVDEYDKNNLSDFALWKAHRSDDAEIYWDHPQLGKGRPGWHIECTLINYLKFPNGTDIHTGGVDLMFPHHTNEIAQAQPVYKPFVRQWMHSEHILIDNKKMSKSLGNVYTLEDLEQKGIATGSDLRYLYLQSHYRTRFNITMQSIAAAKAGLANLRAEIGKIAAQTGEIQESTDHNLSAESPQTRALRTEFQEALSNDLNTPEALAVLAKVLKANISAEQKLRTIFLFDEVLGLDLENSYSLSQKLSSTEIEDPETHALIEQRNEARKNKDFERSDELRKAIEAKGYKVSDTPEGMIVTPQ